MENSLIGPSNLRIIELFMPGHTAAWVYLSRFTYPWEALSGNREFILGLGAELDQNEYERREGNVWIHKSAVVAPSAYFGSAIIIGPGTEVRHCAFIRESVLVGAGAVVGNSTEVKNSILFDEVEAPHYNYIGDSILGYKSHLGAGAITSNIKSDRTLISVACGGERIETGMRKLGAILGDNAEVGCNSVLNPGSIVGADATIYPLSMVRGFIPPDTIYKRQGEITAKE